MRHHPAPLLFAALVCASPSVEAQESLTMAVGTFANRTGDPSLDPLSKGLADMLMTDLSVAKGLTLLERERLQAIVDELKLSGSGLIDPATAQKVGKLVGADLLVVGAFSSVEPTMRIDARLVTVETGEVVATAKAEGPSDRFFAVEADLAKKLLRAFGVALTPMQRLQVDKPSTRSLRALRRWSEALDAIDAKDDATAKQKLEAALAADPTFAKAQKRLAALEERLGALEQRTAAVERAGGLVLTPSGPSDYWSNYRVHVGRRQTMDAISDLQGLLQKDSSKIDALIAHARLVKASKGRAPPFRDVAKFAPRAAKAIVEAITAIVERDVDSADRLTSGLITKDRRPEHLWLRLLALGPDVNPKPTAEEKAEELSLLYELDVGEGMRRLDAIFVGQDSLEEARTMVAARNKHYSESLPGGFQRGQAALPGAAIQFPSPHSLRLRIAEPSPRNVQLTIGGRLIRLKYKSIRGFRSEHAVFEASRLKKVIKKAGLQTAQLKYTDGKGRPVDVKFGVWVPTAVLEGPRWPRVRVGIRGAGKRPLMMSDPLASGWATVRSSGVEFTPVREVLPFASGGFIDYRRPQVFQSGFRRPVVIRTAGGTMAAAGRAEFYWEDRPGRRRGYRARIRNGMESLAHEGGAHEKPWHRYRIGHLYSLLIAGGDREADGADHRQAIDLALGLTEYESKGRAAPWGDPRGALMAAWQRQGGGDYQWLFLLSVSKRLGYRYAELRATAAWLPRADAGQRGFFEAALAYLDGRTSARTFIDRAMAYDAEGRKDSYPDRFLSEAATVVALADDDWSSDRSVLERARRGAAAAHVNTFEWPLLTQALRNAHMSDPAQVEIDRMFIDRWEVTADEYRACVDAGACADVSKVACEKDPYDTPSSSLCWPITPNMYPMNWVGKDHASAYCRWRGGRLPTLAQWRSAARGAPTFAPVRANVLDAPTCTLIVMSDADRKVRCTESLPQTNRGDGWLGPAPKGAHPLGRTSQGVEQLMGNVREWVADGANQSAGCGYADAPHPVIGQRCVARSRREPTRASGHVGFRCVYSRPPGPVPAPKKTAEKAGNTVPKVRFVDVPGGELRFDYADRPLKKGPKTAIEASKAERAATAGRVVGLSEKALSGFLSKLKRLGVTGQVPEHALQELVARGRSTGLSDAQSLDLYLEYIEPPEATGKKAVEEALKAVNERSKARLKLSVYVGAYEQWARAKDMALNQLSKRDRRQAMFDWTMSGNGNREYNLKASAVIDIQPAGATALWWKRGCLSQVPGQCVDPTAGKGELERPRGRREPVKVQPFRLMATEVTQKLYAAVTGQRPSLDSCDACAVTRVAYPEAEAFCKKIGARLPTEVELRWAARGGRGGVAAFKDEIAFLWNTTDAQPSVAKRRPNAHGLFDVLGGVWEWAVPPSRRSKGYKRPVLGGSWRTDPRAIHPDIAVGLHGTNDRSPFVGFRCAKSRS